MKTRNVARDILPPVSRGGGFLVIGAMVASQFLLAAPASAQTTIQVDSVLGCASCQIEFGDAIRLQGEFEDGALLNPGQIGRGSDGHIYMFYARFRTYIDVFSPDGSRSTMQIGRDGDGPGEFRLISHFRVDGDTVRAFDVLLRRRSDFHGPTGRLIRTVRLPGHMDALVFEDGRTVLSGSIGTREAAGYPLHVSGPAGEWQGSFGVDEPTLLPGTESFLTRTFARANGSRFWAAPTNEYRAELWDVEGTLHRTLVAERSWFEPWTENQTGVSRDRPPQTRLFRLTSDEQGMLWILFTVAAENWADAVSDEVDERGNRLLIPGRPYFTTLLEVVDPASGELLARHRFEPNRVVSFASSGALAVQWRDELELPRAEVIPFRLVR